MKQRFSYFKKLPLSTRIFWILMRGTLLIWSIVELATGNTTTGLQALFSFIFAHLWDLFQILGPNSFISKLPYQSQTALTIFIMFGSFFGTVFTMFAQLPLYDKALHAISGAIATWAGYDFAVAMQGKRKPIAPSLAALFSVFFSFFVAVGWEFYEFTMDNLHGTNLQCSTPISDSGLYDTMFDLIACAIGTIIMVFLNSFYKNGLIGKNRKERRAKILEEQRLWDERYDKMMALEQEEKDDNSNK